MSDEVSKLNFADDLAEVKGAAGIERWLIDHVGDLELRVVVSPAAHADEKFLVRLHWSEYPGSLPPSVKFVDSATGRLDVVAAWPEARGFRPGSLDICANWTAEGYRAHPEWLRDPAMRWRSDGNSMLAVLRTLQDELDLTFTGRAK